MERIESNILCPDFIDEEAYYMLSGYKDGCMVAILANPIVHIFKNQSSKEVSINSNRNKEIKVPVFI